MVILINEYLDIKGNLAYLKITDIDIDSEKIYT